MNENSISNRIAENRRSLIECIAIAALIIQITGYGVENRVARISVILVAIAAYLANELYARNFGQLSDMFARFAAPANRRRRMSYAAVAFATSLYIIIQFNFKAPDFTSAFAISVGLFGCGIWLLIEAISMTMDTRYVQIDCGIPDLPERFPWGNVFANLRAMAGDEASDRDLLSIAREFSDDQQWIDLCRHLISLNLPESDIATEMIDGPHPFAFVTADFSYSMAPTQQSMLYEDLLRRVGTKNPSVEELMNAARKVSQEHVFLKLAYAAIEVHNRRIRL